MRRIEADISKRSVPDELKVELAIQLFQQRRTKHRGFIDPQIHDAPQHLSHFDTHNIHVYN
jgi:hypothetical protein